MNPFVAGLVTVLAILAAAAVIVGVEARRRAVYVRRRYAAIRRRYGITEEEPMSETRAPEPRIADLDPMPPCAMCGEPFYAGPGDVACIDCDPGNTTRKATR